ncbi:metallophosphoesterase [Arsenicicoccus dermatophilus]|uniref:metallophosphoesterase n=1 Tax=Arsenicicoccus dermatophilus TaxID=1076331 RepID=UPI0039171BD3
MALTPRLAAAATLALTLLATPAAATAATTTPAATGRGSLVGPTAPDGAFRDPATYDLAIAHITDTQYLSRCANSVMAAQARRCQAIYDGMNRWIVDNAASRKIAYTAHTGDIVDSYWFQTPNLAKGEFAHASQAQQILDDAGMPNGVLPGNHDNARGADASLYNRYFGPARYQAAGARAATPYYQGPWKDGDNSHHVDEFTAGGAKFAVVYLGYKPSDAALAWADEQIKKRPRHNVVVATHAYLQPGAAPAGENAPLSDDGARVRTVVDANPNVFLVLAGHEHGVARNVRQDVGTPGHQVVELMADYQDYDAGADGRGHAGFVRMLQLDVRHGELTVDTYSPSLDSFRSRDYDTQAGRRYDGSEDEFTVAVPLITD